MNALRRRLKRSRNKWQQPHTFHADYNGTDLRFRVDSVAVRSWLYPRYAGGKIHERDVVDLLVPRLTPDSVFFDVGAHIGFFTILGAHFCTGRGSVHAFEANPALIGPINKSVRENEGVGSVVVVNAAVSDRTGAIVSLRASMEDERSTPGLVATGNERLPGSWPLSNAVSTLRLDDYCTETGIWPDVIKMDIEGGEAFALQGMTQILERRPVLAVEIHPAKIESLGADPAKVVETINSLGYESVQVLDWKEHEPGTELTSRNTAFMLFCA